MERGNGHNDRASLQTFREHGSGNLTLLIYRIQRENFRTSHLTFNVHIGLKKTCLQLFVLRLKLHINIKFLLHSFTKEFSRQATTV